MKKKNKKREKQISFSKFKNAAHVNIELIQFAKVRAVQQKEKHPKEANLERASERESNSTEHKRERSLAHVILGNYVRR